MTDDEYKQIYLAQSGVADLSDEEKQGYTDWRRRNKAWREEYAATQRQLKKEAKAARKGADPNPQKLMVTRGGVIPKPPVRRRKKR